MLAFAQKGKVVKLSIKQKRYLKGLAHSIKPLVYVGKNGVTVSFCKEVAQVLFDHELIKVKFNEYKSDKKTLAHQLATTTNAQMIGMIGNTVILYRQQEQAEKRRIHV